MGFLLLSLASSVGIFLFFKIFHLNNISLLKAVTVNYLACTATGLIYHSNMLEPQNLSGSTDWVPIAIIMGGTFFFTFFLMGKTTAKNGVSIASMATKLSLVFPTLISMVWLKTVTPNPYLTAALIISIPSIILASMKRERVKKVGWSFFLPIAVFTLSGMIDGAINLLNFKFSESNNFVFFPVLVFFFAAISGIIFHLFRRGERKQWLDKRVWIYGTGLGVANYFSIEFLLQGLVHFNNNGALVFPFLNVGIILVTSVLGILFFKEKLIRENYLGLSLALISLVLLIISSRV